jgi:hypothetical protein
VLPQAASLALDSGPFSGAGNVLAREASGHDVNEASPWSAIECPHVVPYRESWKPSIALSGQQDAAGVGIKLDSADGAPAKQVPSQDAASCPCK